MDEVAKLVSAAAMRRANRVAAAWICPCRRLNRNRLGITNGCYLKGKVMPPRRKTELPLTDYCSECEARVQYAVVHLHKRSGLDGCPEEYTLAACAVCGEPSLFYRQEVSLQREILEIDSPVFNRLYPTSPRLISFDLPEAVGRSYDEACEAESTHLPMASAVMVGRALEATCKHFDHRSGSIADGLRRMRAGGLLSEELYEWASELRVLRNEAAHASHAGIGELEASEAVDFLQAILEIIYDIRPKFQRFKARRAAQK
jgi:hypothetical protein